MGDKSAEWAKTLEDLIGQPVQNPPPANNAVNARIPNIDGNGTAALVSNLNSGNRDYQGFGLIFQHDPNYEDYDWLQFITRQLVVDGVAQEGNLVMQGPSAAYALVESPDEVTDYDFPPGTAKPANWDTCWKVDSNIKKPDPFLRFSYESAVSEEKKLRAILDAPTVLTGKIPLKVELPYFEDVPEELVVMSKFLGKNKEGTSRAYFSDYLMKKEGENWRIIARVDFNQTWTHVKEDTKRAPFELRSVKTTETSVLLDCHRAALLHTTTKNIQPWVAFNNKIIP